MEIEPERFGGLDAVWAGDIFAGAFLNGRTQGWSRAQAARIALRSATDMIMTGSPRPPQPAVDQVKPDTEHRFDVRIAATTA